jgi:hypothetical protein
MNFAELLLTDFYILKNKLELQQMLTKFKQFKNNISAELILLTQIKENQAKKKI